MNKNELIAELRTTIGIVEGTIKVLELSSNDYISHRMTMLKYTMLRDITLMRQLEDTINMSKPND